MIRIAHIMGKMNGGGVEQVVMNYYQHIDRSVIQFDFLVDSDSTLVPTADIERRGGRIFLVPPYQNPIRHSSHIKRLCMQENWPIVHSHINTLSIFPLKAAKQAGVPVRIAHAHSTAGPGEPAKNILKNLLRSFSNLYPTHRFACNQHAGNWLFGKKEVFEIVPNAIELDNFTFNPTARLETRIELGLDSNDFVIGHIGRFMRQKNHDFLIDVFSNIASQCPNAKLLLVGEGELKAKIQAKVQSRNLANRILFLGQRNDVSRLYQAFDLFVLPSLYEGQPVVAIEAQASRLPCLFSDAISESAIISEEAISLPGNDMIAWESALLQHVTLRTPARRNETHGIAEDYNIGIAAKKLSLRYNSLVKESQSGV